MALQTIEPYLVWPWHGSSGTTVVTLDASGEKCAWVFRATGTSITGFYFRTSTVTTGETLKVSVQGINSSGEPDGTILGSGNASATVASPTSNNNYDVTFTSAASVTVGTQYAIVIEFDATVGDVDLRHVANSTYGPIAAGLFYDHYGISFAGSTWTKTAGWLFCAIEYSSSYNFFDTPFFFGGRTTTTFNNASTPDEVGVVFTLPFTARVRALFATCDIDVTGATADLILYDASDTNLGSVTFAATDGTTNGNDAQRYAVLSSPVTLQRDTTYRLVWKPTTANNIRIAVMSPQIPTVGQEAGQRGWSRTSRTDAGSWTDNSGGLTPDVWLVMDAIDVGAGAAGVGTQLVR